MNLFLILKITYYKILCDLTLVFYAGNNFLCVIIVIKILSNKFFLIIFSEVNILDSKITLESRLHKNDYGLNRGVFDYAWNPF